MSQKQIEKAEKNTKKVVSKKVDSKKDSINTNMTEDKKLSITDDKMINEVLGNIGKKTTNASKKLLINNFMDEKKKYDNKKNNKDIKEDENSKKTFTQNLTKEEINEKLEDYKLVDDISKVPLGTHLRYFTNKNGQKIFRMGGNLKRNLDLPNFVILQNAVGVEWSVQVKDTLFYKKMSITEIKEEYDKIILDLHDKIKKLKNRIKELEK